jgi:hypothetical protein
LGNDGKSQKTYTSIKVLITNSRKYYEKSIVNEDYYKKPRFLSISV